MDNTFSAIANIIKTRRSVKAPMMNGNKIPNGNIAALLELANWAPTHACTEPWRFMVYENPSEFCRQHADVYKQNTTPDNFNPTVFNNLTRQGDNASHIIVAVMKRGSLEKIPPFEEVAAASCAIQNMLLGATALNIASFWSTGGMALKPALKEYLGYGDSDQIMGILYFGYVDKLPDGRRNTGIEEKTTWIK